MSKVDEIGFGGFWLFGFDAAKMGSLLGRKGKGGGFYAKEETVLE